MQLAQRAIRIQPTWCPMLLGVCQIGAKELEVAGFICICTVGLTSLGANGTGGTWSGHDFFSLSA